MGIFGAAKVLTQADHRTIHALGSAEAAPYATNKIITSHYTLANFLPKNLAEQFSKAANCYFAFLVCLQCTPRVTTTGQFPTILFPLMCILALNAAKDAVEDYRRHQSDKDENDRTTVVCHSKQGDATDTKWYDVRVGDIVVLKSGDFIPADMVLLSSANESGQAYVETANLDGETNLKTKVAPEKALGLIPASEKYSDAVSKAKSLAIAISCEGPNDQLYSFNGTLEISEKAGASEKVPLNEENVFLRGCKMKNVPWAMGMVVYTGRESKIMQNSKKVVSRKLSHLERDMSKFVVAILVAQCVLCLVAAIISASFETSSDAASRTYLNLTDRNGQTKDSGILLGLFRFGNFFLLFSNFVPISLLVCVSMVKLFQVGFFYLDKTMIYQGIHCIPRTSDLNEELGQIDYVFSDKTGTLTCNIMDFRKFCVDGIVFGEGVTEIKRNVLMKMGLKVPEPTLPDPDNLTPHVNLVDQKLDDILAKRSSTSYSAVRNLLLHLAINHEVIPEASDGTLSGSSPDETALVYGAKHFGFILKDRDSQGVTVMVEDGFLIKVKILALLKFNSARKRSSVIVQFEDKEPNGTTRQKLMLYTKGADTMIIARLNQAQMSSPETKKTMEVLNEFAVDGLRTLCLGGRELTMEEFTTWMAKYEAACLSMENRQETMDEVMEDIEKDLELHGITGVEDRLQDQVADTIVSMSQAGIKVWMLTGDKIETAINIGIATGLLEPEAGVRPMFTTPDFEEGGVFQRKLLLDKLGEVADQANKAAAKKQMFEGMVIDGECLAVVLEPENARVFAAIGKVCKTVVCCRVSPKQKGSVVRLIKTTEGAITLAIGDGANDCNMIQEAHVGIGIRGLEGLQAFNVCDYGIAQFRFLQTLLLVHGRWCYRRVAILANYMFYKNIVLVLPQYFLGFVSWFSGQKLYNDILYQSYNVFHTSMPIVFFGVLDQDVGRDVASSNPQLYALGPKKAYLNVKVCTGWVLSGLWHALVVFFIPYYTMSNGNVTHADGKSNDIWMVGTVVYLLVCIVTNIRVLLETFFISWIVWFGMFLSFFGWIGEQALVSGMAGILLSQEVQGTTQRLFGCPMLYLLIIVSTLMAVGVDIHVKGFMHTWRPNALDRIQDQVLLEKSKGKSATS